MVMCFPISQNIRLFYHFWSTIRQHLFVIFFQGFSNLLGKHVTSPLDYEIGLQRSEKTGIEVDFSTY